MEATSFRCPCCGAALVFGPDTQEMTCASCGNTFALENLQQAQQVQVHNTRAEDMHWDMPEREPLKPEEMGSLRAYRCETCGAQILADPAVAATECVYCGNPTILPGVLEGAHRPDGVIPFRKTKEEAMAAYKNHCQGKKLLPTGFYSDAVLEKITGVYVPFWLFQCRAEADMTFNATKVRTFRQGQYMVTRTSHYLVRRGGTMAFDQVPVDGSRKMDDALMESIEPFDAGKMQDFQIAYLSGYQAQRPDVEAESCVPRANERILNSARTIIGNTVLGYTTAVPANTQVDFHHGQVKQVLMPVWLLNTKWQGETYTFAMNAQTGRFIGDLPTDRGKFWKWLLGLTAGIGTAGCVACYLLMALGVM